MRKSRMQKLVIACIATFAVLGGVGATNAQTHGGGGQGGGGFHGGRRVSRGGGVRGGWGVHRGGGPRRGVPRWGLSGRRLSRLSPPHSVQYAAVILMSTR